LSKNGKGRSDLVPTGRIGSPSTYHDDLTLLHPHDAGYKAMAEAVDLALFKTEPVPGRTSRSGK
jgi:hypothetical protein